MTTSLHPLLAQMLEAASAPPSPGATLDDRRAAVLDGLAQVAAVHAEPGPEVGRVTGVELPGPDGTTLRGRLYEMRPDEPDPVLLQLHGGGWWQGSAFSPVIDTLARERCALGCDVLILEYRQAPEHPFPAALDDVTAALSWLESARDEGQFGDVIVAGQSAGGNLAAAAVLRDLRTGRETIRGLLLEVPVLDLTAPREPDGITTEPILDGLRECMDLYVPDAAVRADELVSPLLADDVAGHPPTAVITAELDILRPDGLRYARMLSAAGVPTTYDEMRGHLHGSGMLTRSYPPAREWRATAHARLGGLLAGEV